MMNMSAIAISFLVGGLVTGVSPSIAMSQCYDVDRGQPATLTGTLDYVLFAGPPNFEDVQKGDTPEPSFVLRLAQPICLSGGDGFADPKSLFRNVQLVETKQTSGQLKPFLHRQVTVRLTDQMAAETGHHHEPLVAWVTGIASASHPMEFIEEYGTPATTIRAFYAALSEGQGDIASKLVVSEKRSHGPFSASELSRFYGHLRHPIRLEEISSNSPTQFVVRYRYSATAHECSGRAVVTTEERGGNNYIQRIDALDGC